ncbi:amidohydrolase family protein [Pseudodesulfovibrio tunisiensis]|uniref:amidohydrolase family protein n=1 Tax=Pseudodesulfovibrio tunisiensis TaxID=463192 RepID=UPI001FB517A9|nr:amidohydrolase family protein [Pseudodesulfovibrio tunisiensis]
MDIIDFRFRPNTQATIDGFTKSTMFKGMFAKMDLTRLYAQSVPEVVDMISKEGYVKAVITGRDCSGTYDAKSNNEGVKAFVREFPDMFLGFMGVDPNRGMDAIYELDKDIREDGMHGACIDPYLAKMFVNDARYYPVYSKCCELDIPVIVATGPGTLVPGAVMEHAAPRYIDYVARDFPQLKIIISHGGYPWVEEAIMITERNENVYMELSEYERHPGGESYVKAAANLIGDKILFASAHPGADFRDALAMYKGFGLSEDVMEQIMFRNAQKVLGL